MMLGSQQRQTTIGTLEAILQGHAADRGHGAGRQGGVVADGVARVLQGRLHPSAICLRARHCGSHEKFLLEGNALTSKLNVISCM